MLAMNTPCAVTSASAMPCVVEGVCANVLKPFVAGDQIVQFNPRGPEDEEQAEQETDYIRHVLFQKNPGFLKDACSAFGEIR